jgi:hypothetical protein
METADLKSGKAPKQFDRRAFRTRLAPTRAESEPLWRRTKHEARGTLGFFPRFLII